MIKEFYTRALPLQGVYCVADIDPLTKKTRHEFVESIDDLVKSVEAKSKQDTNVFVAMSSFKGYSRKADNASYARSLFVDLDVGDGKGYDSKEEALSSLDKFVYKTDIPIPVTVDSGTGIHAYWFLDRDVPAAEWKIYAEKFKDFCLSNGLFIDPVVTADLSRILRSPATFNHKTNPPSPTKVIFWSDSVCSFEGCKGFLGEAELEKESITQSLPSTISGEQRKLLKLDNFESSFEKIIGVSRKGKGCNQIKYILDNAQKLTEPLWYSGLSIAQHCEDRDAAIHIISQDYPGYNFEETEKKATQSQDMPHSCETFNSINPGICNGCSHRGKITNPLALGKVFKQAEETMPVESSIPATAIEAVEEQHNPLKKQRGLVALPDGLYPYVYGKQGGIYYMPTPKYDEEGAQLQPEPILVTLYDVFPIKRIYSPTDGDCLLMKAVLPHDPEREFLLPMRYVYAVERLKEIMASQGVLFNSDPKGAQYLMNYVIKWGHYLMSEKPAEIMRMQMGWTPEKESFVVGDTELTRKGEEVPSPTSPLCRSIAKHLTPSGDYQTWKKAANRLNQRTLELHAFTLLTGFGSAIMNYTSTSGVTVCLTGESGAAKTGALYSSLSVWGNPKDLSVLEATANGMTGRYLGLQNIPFGLDEVGNIKGADLSQLIHKVSQGKSKIRMQASVNAEREHEMSASLIAIFTSNHSLYDKLSILKKDPNGEVARLIEFSVKKPQLFKDDAQMGREIFDKFRFNYGWAGRDFIFNLYKYSDTEIQHMMEAWVDRFRKDFGEDTAYRFYENLISATLTAGQVALKAHIIDYDLDRIYDRLVSELIAIRDNVVKVNQVDYVSLVGEFINSHQTGILALEEGKISMEPRSPLVIRAEMDNNIVFISRPEFRKFLSENMVSSREFTHELGKLGTEVKEVKKRLGAGWKGATGSIIVIAYALKLDKFKDALETANDTI